MKFLGTDVERQRDGDSDAERKIGTQARDRTASPTEAVKKRDREAVRQRVSNTGRQRGRKG